MDQNQRKPVAMMRKHLTKAEKAKRESEEKAAATDKDQLLEPPAWLSGRVAVREWKRITKELLKLDIIGNLDVDALGAYCNALASYIDITDQLKGEPTLIEVELSGGATKMVINPLMEAQRRAADEMRRFGRLCGITLDSRLKAAAIKTSKEEDELEKEFGVI